MKFFRLLILCATLSAHAQDATDSASDGVEANVSSSAWLRVWVMLPPEIMPEVVGNQPKLADKLSLGYDAGEGQLQLLVGRATPFTTTGYTELPAANTTLRLVRKTGDKTSDLAKVSAPLKAGSFYTVIVQKQGGRHTLALVDDTPKPPEKKKDSAETPPKQVVFHNFLADSPTEISSTNPPFKQEIHFGKSATVSDLPARVFNVTMPVKTGDKVDTTSIEIDLRTYDSLSFLIVKDLYGRTAALVFPNGKLE
jgi:hypothetical protein